MVVGEFWEAMSVYQEEKDADRRHIGELVRGAAHLLWNIQVGEKNKIKDVATFWPMPWDTKTPGAADRLAGMTKEERDAAARDFIRQLESNG